MNEVTRILSEIERGDPHAAEQLFPLLATTATPDQLQALAKAQSKLARGDPAAARLVELCTFAGLIVHEAGKTLGISAAIAYRHWNYARAWLHAKLLGSVES